MENKIVERFKKWMYEFPASGDIVGISEQNFLDQCNIILYCKKTPKVLGYFWKYFQDLERQIESLSDEDKEYTLSLRLVDYYEETSSHMIDISKFNNHKEKIDISEVIEDWAIGYGKNNIAHFLRSQMSKGKDKMKFVLSLYSKDNHILLGNPEGSVKSLKQKLHKRFENIDFTVNVYESNLAII